MKTNLTEKEEKGIEGSVIFILGLVIGIAICRGFFPSVQEKTNLMNVCQDTEIMDCINADGVYKAYYDGFLGKIQASCKIPEKEMKY